MQRRDRLAVLVVLSLSVALSACTGNATQETVPPTEPAQSELVPEPTEVNLVEPPTEPPAETAVVESPATEETAPTEEPPRPALKTSLVATDPTSVDLNSNKPTLVEFFAFW